MFGAFQFQYTIDFFLKSRPLAKVVCHTAWCDAFYWPPVSKKKLSSRWCYLYITLLIVEQCIWTTEKTYFPVSVCIDRSMILQTLDSRTGNEVNYCKYRLILSFRMRWFNRAQMIALGSIETQSFCLYCGTGRNWCCNRSLFFSK